MDKIFSKCFTPAMLVWVLTSFITKIRVFSTKAVDILFGKVLEGKGRGFTLSSMKCRIIHQFAPSTSTEQLNNLMYNYEDRRHRETEDAAQCI